MVLILASASYIEKPLEGYMLEEISENGSKKIKEDLSNLDVNEALSTARFYFIWVMMFINISCGIALISSASPMMQEKLGYTAIQAATIVGFIGVFNGL